MVIMYVFVVAESTCMCVYAMSFHDYNSSLLPRLSKIYHIMLPGRIQRSIVTFLFLLVQSYYMMVVGV